MSKVVDIARSYIGKTEKKANSGFNDAEFEKKMRAIGFYTGAPWCGFFARLVWREAEEDYRLVQSSAVRTIHEGQTAGNLHKEAAVGAVGVMRTYKNGKPQSTGHIFIVTSVGLKIGTIEGNTSENGSREGTIVAERQRNENWTISNGLRMVGYIHPKK